ncbi:MAG: polysaccharide deacetylase family protein [Candidatus Binataceae bacterium]
MGKVTLSFDNGPEPTVTGRVLDILKAFDVRTTFFVIGAKLVDPARYSLAQRAGREGHWIGNHSLTHKMPFGETREEGAASIEIGEAQEAIGILAHPDRLFRPFGGGGRLDKILLNREALNYLIAGHYTCVLWNCVPHDWDQPEQWVDNALSECDQRPWSLVVLHDLPTGAMVHLERFLDRLRVRHEIVQEFPPDCVPIRRGMVTTPIDAYVAD